MKQTYLAIVVVALAFPVAMPAQAANCMEPTNWFLHGYWDYVNVVVRKRTEWPNRNRVLSSTRRMPPAMCEATYNDGAAHARRQYSTNPR